MCYTFTEILSFLKIIVYITSFFHSFHTIKKDRELFCLRIKNIYSFLFFYDGLDSRSIHKQQFLRNTNMAIAFTMEYANISQLRIVQ